MGTKRGEGITRIVQFKTEDGKIHPTFAEAQRHKSENEFIIWCQNNLPTQGDPDPEQIAKIIRQSWNLSKKRPK